MAAEGDLVGQGLALLQLAEIRMHSADPATAAELMRQALALLPAHEVATRARVGSILGQALVDLGEYDEASAIAATEPRGGAWTGSAVGADVPGRTRPGRSRPG